MFDRGNSSTTYLIAIQKVIICNYKMLPNHSPIILAACLHVWGFLLKPDPTAINDRHLFVALRIIYK